MIAAANNPNTTLEQRAAAEQQLSNAMVNLRATAEAYPDLKANQNFMDLQQKLAGLEDKIAYGRQFYNDVVLKYNNKIMQVPTDNARFCALCDSGFPDMNMARTGYDFQSLTQENRDWKEARAMSKEIIQFDQAMFETKLDAMVRDKVEQIVNAMLDE